MELNGCLYKCDSPTPLPANPANITGDSGERVWNEISSALNRSLIPLLVFISSFTCATLFPFDIPLYSSGSQSSLPVLLYHMKLTSWHCHIFRIFLDSLPFICSRSPNATWNVGQGLKWYLLHKVYFQTVTNNLLHWSFIPFYSEIMNLIIFLWYQW